MSLNPQDKESAKVNDTDTEQAGHIAELLEIVGAAKINAAVELRVAAMKVKEKSKITRDLASAARRASATGRARQAGEHQAIEGGMATALAASKLKARAKQVYSPHFLRPAFPFCLFPAGGCPCLLRPGRLVLMVAAPAHPLRLQRKKRRKQCQTSSPAFPPARCRGLRQGPSVGFSIAGFS